MPPKDKDDGRIIDKRRITLDDALHGHFIPMYEGRPKREEVIGKDDVLNLEIVLNTCNTVESFLEAV